MSKPVFVISCPFDTYSGYGARARDIVKAIIELDKYDVKLLPQRWGETPGGFCNDHDEWKFLWKHSISQINQQPDIWMQITIPNEFNPIGKYNIGCTAGIESTGCDVTWIEGVNRMDMTWTSSKHSKQVFEQLKFEKRNQKTKQIESVVKVEKPIHVVFEGVNLDVYKHLPNKSEIGLDLSQIKEQFCFLFVGHWMNGSIGHDRKNVGLMIKYFFDAFKNKPNQPALILKASLGRNSYMSREQILDRIYALKSDYRKDKLPNVYLLNGGLSDTEMNELYNHPKVKAMVSFTKGEGYGRPLAEFCLSKKPLIVSGWSGHTDFISQEFSTWLPGKLENVHPTAANNWLKKEFQWFQVSPKHAVSAFKSLKSKYNKFIDGGKRQGYKIKTEFSWDKMKELVGNILEHNIPEFPKKVELNLPTIETPKL